ncbi:hypothetical protein DSCA_02300 [Desulfosarcina alkanivorans]|uniref:Uncharacterized protein n=1 Tax=Desulfosarcina alkanivorans TaxID=571177 RepID=A0A5K7YE76_9BACT|nr:hypothetical protein DSCA_02300 [Desulfosarcina alkanivorans]
MGHTGMVTIIIMVPEAAMITAIVAPTGLFTAPTVVATTDTDLLATGTAEADTVGGDRVYSPQYE